jgi:hypothetical protein
MLLPIPPHPLILPPIRPIHNPISLFLIINILTHIPPMVRPDELPLPAHFVAFPVTLVSPSIGPLIPPFTLDKVLQEITGIG